MGTHLTSQRNCSIWLGIQLKIQLLALLQTACTCIMRKLHRKRYISWLAFFVVAFWEGPYFATIWCITAHFRVFLTDAKHMLSSFQFRSDWRINDKAMLLIVIVSFSPLTVLCFTLSLPFSFVSFYGPQPKVATLLTVLWLELGKNVNCSSPTRKRRRRRKQKNVQNCH